jgi:hypothetical protein
MLSLICLFVMLWFWPVNILKAALRQSIPPMNFVIAAAATCCFIYFRGLL